MRLSEMTGADYARWESSYLTPRDADLDEEGTDDDDVR